MKKLLVLVLMLSMISCRSSKEVSSFISNSASYDSTVHEVREEVQGTKVTVAADSALIRALLECDSAGNIHLRELELIRGQRITPQFILKNNRILVPIKVDSMSIYHLFKTKYESNTHTNSKEKSKIEYKFREVKVIDWSYVRIAFFLGAIASIVVYLLLKFKL